MSIQQASRHRSSPQVLRRKGWNRHGKRMEKADQMIKAPVSSAMSQSFLVLCLSAIDMIDSFKSLQISETRQICGIFRSRCPNQRKDARHRVLWQ